MDRYSIPIAVVQRWSCPLLRTDLATYLMHDQPTMCPICGRRTSWIGENPQLHTCHCGYQFFVEEDEDFGYVEIGDRWIPEQEALSISV